MPDSAERAHILVPTRAAGGQALTATGYTNLESCLRARHHLLVK